MLTSMCVSVLHHVYLGMCAHRLGMGTWYASACMCISIFELEQQQGDERPCMRGHADLYECGLRARRRIIPERS